MAKMHLVAIAKVFYIIFDVLFLLLFAASQLKKELLGLISNYFAIVEINSHSILYLYYLV